MKKALLVLVIIALAGLGFYAYTQSGTPLDEPVPQGTSPVPPKTPAPAETLTPETPLSTKVQQEINQMIRQAQEQRSTMSSEEKAEMETKSTMMMNPGMTVDEEASWPPEGYESMPENQLSKGMSMMEEAKVLMNSEDPDQAARGEAMMNEAETIVETATAEITANEELRASSKSRVGYFTKIDPIHQGSGKAVILPNTVDGPILRLEDFSVTRGPDLHVYLSRNANVQSADDLGSYHDLGLLKSSKGNQNYALPSNHTGFKSVVIWCQAFGVLFSSATLVP